MIEGFDNLRSHSLHVIEQPDRLDDVTHDVKPASARRAIEILKQIRGDRNRGEFAAVWMRDSHFDLGLFAVSQTFCLRLERDEIRRLGFSHCPPHQPAKRAGRPGWQPASVTKHKPFCSIS